MYPSYNTAGSINHTASGNNTPTPPTHQANDILIIACENDTGTTSTSTSGWTEIKEVTPCTPSFAWYWKRATDSSTAGATLVPSNAANDLWAICYVIRGCITTDTPYEDATSANAAANTTPDTSEITTTDSARLTVCSLVVADDDSWSVSPPPTGWTTQSDETSTGGNDARFTLITKQQSSAGDVTSAEIGTLSSGKDWGTLTLAFIPTPGGAMGASVGGDLMII